MIDRIRFKNYRIFRMEQELQIRPITIVFGKNNTGKSAILKLPALIDNILNNNGDEVVSDSFGNGPRLFTELRDIIYGKATKSIEISGYDDHNKVSLDCAFFVDPTIKPSSRIERCVFTNGTEKHIIQWESDNAYHIDDSINTKEIEFKGIIPLAQHITSYIEESINKLKFSVDYIGSIRVFPNLDMRLQNSKAETSGVDGSNSYQMLIADALGANVFTDKVSKWYEENFSGWKINVEKSRLPVIHIEMEKDGIHNNIIETGMGIVQSLPIVVRACAPCINPTLVVLEEPETHLHPAAHASLGELIAMSTKNDANKRYLIETHSKNFILRLRRLVANRQLNAEDIALYYVDFDESKSYSTLRPININNTGSVDFWPSQMFDESLQETIAIRTIQMQQEYDSRN